MANSASPSRLIALLIVAAAASGCVRTTQDVQRDYAQKLRPVEFGQHVPPVPAEPAQVKRVRVYADDDYQVQAGDWQARVLAQVRRANAALVTDLGVSLEVESLRSWPREDRAVPLEESLVQLEAHDPGEDVDWVVGLVSSSQIFSASHHHLGMARLFGRHFVLRGMDSPAEAQHLSRVLDKLPAGEREALFRERRLHKETAIFLHEWAHTLGAFHDRTVDWLMSRTYDEHQALFSEPTVGLLRLGLRHRDQKAPEARKAWAEAYRGHVNTKGSSDWHEESRAQALRDVEQVLEGKGGPVQTALGKMDRLRFNEAVRLFNAGKYVEADAQLSPLVAQHPAHADIQELGCLVSHRHAPSEAQALQRCAQAASLPEARANAHLLLAHIRLEGGDAPGGLADLARAQARLAAGEPNAEGWLYLASLGQRASAPSVVESAVARLSSRPEAAGLADWAVRLRRWTAVPKSGEGVTAEDEPELIVAVLAAEKALADKQRERAVAQRDLLVHRFKHAPATALVECALALHDGRSEQAKAFCQGVVAKDPEATKALHILGQLLLGERNPALAKVQFKRVVELAPDLESGWINLALAHRTLGETAALAELDRQYQARFGRALPR